MDVYEELFGNRRVWDMDKLHHASTNYPKIIAKLAVNGIDEVVIYEEELWISFVSHPSILKHALNSMTASKGNASFTMFGVTFIYQGEKE